MIGRDTYTKIFLQQWNKSFDEANVNMYGRKWWQSNRASKQSSLRLSEEGFNFLTTDLDLSAYEIPFTEPIDLSPQTILFLEKYIDCPYYLTNQSVTVFSEKKSFELMLFSDDIRKYGLIKAINEREKSQKNN